MRCLRNTDDAKNSQLMMFHQILKGKFFVEEGPIEEVMFGYLRKMIVFYELLYACLSVLTVTCEQQTKNILGG